MSKVHQICPICAACNTKRKDGYYMCCACRHKWRDVESSVFDRLKASPEVLAEKLVYEVSYKEFVGELMYVFTSWESTIIPNVRFETKPEAIAATVAKLKEVAE